MATKNMTFKEALSKKEKRKEKRTLVEEYYFEHSKAEYLGKRFLDIFLSILGFIPLIVVSPVIYLGIKFSSKGPIFFKQKRRGLNGKSFLCYKLRTMHVFYDNPSHEKPAITQKADVRVFTFGSFLRKSNLDELPQLFNVLKGDMSLVGPRPYMENECTYWNNLFDDFLYRYSVKPGISGLAQVKGYRGGTLDEAHMRKRLDWDLIYVESQSMWLDIKIIVKTLFQMLHLNTNAH